MRSAIALAACLGLAALTGCAAASRSDTAYRALAKLHAPVIPPQGLFYTHLKAPISLEATDFGAKRGTATSEQIGLPPLPFYGLQTGLDLFAWSDASLQAAAAAGGITEVEHVDYELTVVLFFYRRFTIEVYGN